LPSGVVTRFAPSPTGRLHRGNAFSALTAANLAAQPGGRFLLRIEDIDTTRCRPEFEAAIEEDLAWIGLTWEQPVRRQSEHTAFYRSALSQLEAEGLVYPCDRTRREVLESMSRAPQAGDPADKLRGIAEGQVAWRLSMKAAQRKISFENLVFHEEVGGPSGEKGAIPVDPTRVGDVVLGRKGLGVSYHLAVVLDDALQGVTHVTRGVDIFESTHVQRVLQALLGLPTPIYRHHRLIMRPDGKRFAKRDTGETLRELRTGRLDPWELRSSLGF